MNRLDLVSKIMNKLDLVSRSGYKEDFFLCIGYETHKLIYNLSLDVSRKIRLFAANNSAATKRHLLMLELLRNIQKS